MKRKKKSFYLYAKDLDLGIWLDSKGELSNFVKEQLNKIRLNQLIDSKSIDLQRKKLEVDIRYKEIMIKLKEKELMFTENFGKTPSYQSKIAIKNNVTQFFDPPEEKNLRNIIDNGWMKFCSHLKNKSDGWVIICSMCSTGFPQLATKEIATERLKTHLEETHSKELLNL